MTAKSSYILHNFKAVATFATSRVDLLKAEKWNAFIYYIRPFFTNPVTFEGLQYICLCTIKYIAGYIIIEKQLTLL